MHLSYHSLKVPLGIVVWVTTSYHDCALEGTFDMVDVHKRMLRFSEVDLTYPLWISLRSIRAVDMTCPAHSS